MKSLLLSSSFGIALLLALGSIELQADEPGGMPPSIEAGEDLTFDNPGNELWLVFTAEEDGCVMVLAHDTAIDLRIEIYSEDWRNGPLMSLDSDIGDVGNEFIYRQVDESEHYYIRVAPLSGTVPLPSTSVMCGFIPGGTIGN